MHFKSLAAAAAACALAAGVAPADAGTIITTTYTGTVNRLQDRDGLLGTVIDLSTPTNLAFTSTFVFRLEDGLRITQPIDGIASDNLLGGSVFGGGAPLLSSTLTVGGVTLDFLGGYASQQFVYEGFTLSSTADDRTGDVWRILNVSMETNAPGLLTTPYSGSAVAHDRGAPGAAICKLVAGNCVDQRFDARFTVETAVVTVATEPTGVVPEPGTWALMIAGFGMAGGALRRARRVAAAG